MVVVECDYNDLKKLTGLDKDKIINGLTDIGAPCEARDNKIIIELTPNRPDLFFITGLARALNSFYKKKINDYACKKSEYKVIVDKSVEKIRPYTICAVVKNLKLDQKSIDDLIQAQEKLVATIGRKTKKFGMGFFPLKNLNFPIKYTTMKPEEIVYKPLNYPNVANAKEILEKHAKGIENGYIIKQFDRYPVFLDAKNKIMVLIPIVNSEELGKIDEHTEELFIEVTGNDLNVIKQVLNIVVCSLIDMGGIAYSVEMQYPDKKFFSLDLKEKEMKLDLNFLNKILGLTLNKTDVESLLKKMGYRTNKNNVLIPPYRLDIMHFVDIVEDIAIAYGYNNFKLTLPNFFTKGEMINDDYNKIDEIMKNMGFMEIKTTILTNKVNVHNIYGEEIESEITQINNPVSEDFTIIRPSLLGNMLETFTNNKTKGLPQKLYEIDYVRRKNKTEKAFIFGVMDKSLDFSDARSYLQTIFEELGLSFELKKAENSMFDSVVSSSIFINHTKKGDFGLINKKLLERYGLGFPIYVCQVIL